jgi:hypothetical protein
MGTVALTRLLTEDPEKSVGALLDPEGSRISPEGPSNGNTVAPPSAQSRRYTNKVTTRLQNGAAQIGNPTSLPPGRPSL